MGLQAEKWAGRLGGGGGTEKKEEEEEEEEEKISHMCGLIIHLSRSSHAKTAHIR